MFQVVKMSCLKLWLEEFNPIKFILSASVWCKLKVMMQLWFKNCPELPAKTSTEAWESNWCLTKCTSTYRVFISYVNIANKDLERKEKLTILKSKRHQNDNYSEWTMFSFSFFFTYEIWFFASVESSRQLELIASCGFPIKLTWRFLTICMANFSAKLSDFSSFWSPA